MTNPKGNIKGSPRPQPAGEAPGSDLPPGGQGGPHLPTVEKPTSKSLSDLCDEKFPKPHKCSICGSPNHFACGCEARAREKDSAMDPEMVREDAVDCFMDQKMVLTESEQKLANSFDEYADRLDERITSILDSISDVNSNLEALVKMEKDRVDLLKDLKNGHRN